MNGQDAYKAVRFNRVLDPWLIEDLRQDLEMILPWKAIVTVHDVDAAQRAGNVMKVSSLQEGLNAMKQDGG